MINKKMGMIVFLIASVIFSFKTTNYQKVSASNDLEYIGKLYKVTHVDNLTKVYIPYSNISFINDAGRQVYSEGSNYYYYADANNPILRSSKDLYNDYESLVYVVEYLEDEFYYYNPNCNVKNAVLSYIRGIDTRYFNKAFLGYDLYYVVCGNANVDNIVGIHYQHSFTYQYEFLDSYNFSGIRAAEFFASFIENDDCYNGRVYGEIRNGYLGKHLRLVNPRNKISNIDLIHLFASMDGNFLGTGHSTYNSPFNAVSSNVYRYMVSWLGDIQTASLNMERRGIIISSFDDVLYGNYGCDFYDFNADLDATNMAFNVDLDANNESISTIILNYYSLFSNPTFYREKMFSHKIAYAAHNDSVFKFDDLKYVLYLMMNLNYITGNNIDEWPYSIETNIICHFLIPDDSFMPAMVTPANRRMILACLCSHLYNCCY